MAGIQQALFGSYGALVGDFESIASFTTGAGNDASITFSSIPATYTHLQIRVTARGTVADTSDAAYVTFNSDTGTNYAGHYLNGNGTAAAAASVTSSAPAYPMYVFFFPAANATASAFGVGVADILDYASTSKTKVLRSITGADSNGNNSSGRVYLQSVLWNSTSAITTIKLTPMNGSFAQYSHFALYGIKG